MPTANEFKSGRHFLQIPGPSNVPDRVLRAIDQPTIDHRGPEFAALTLEILDRLKTLFGTRSHVVMYPSSGTGAWEAALVNTLSPGDRVLAFDNGQFATLWCGVAQRLGLEVVFEPGDWREAVDPVAVEQRLREDQNHTIKAVMVVHNETSTGVVSPIAEIRRAIDRSGHPALYLVDTVSSLGSMEFRHDDWGADVTVCGSQKGMMLPPGIGFNAIGEKAIRASETAKMSKAYWDWAPIIKNNEHGFFPYTPSTNLLYGLCESLTMLMEEGLDHVFARHHRLAEATRHAVAGWGLEILCRNPANASDSLTAVIVPDGYDADDIRKIILERFDLSLGVGLGQLAGNVFRIGHLGDLNDLTLAGTLAGVEMGLAIAQVPHEKNGVTAALDYLAQTT